MSDTIILVLSILGAIAIAIAITAWRIRRLQYPPELRWPSEKNSRRENAARRSKAPFDETDRNSRP